MLDEELDELRSDADLIIPLPRPRPTLRPAAVAPPATLVPSTPLPPGIGLLGMTWGLPEENKYKSCRKNKKKIDFTWDRWTTRRIANAAV